MSLNAISFRITGLILLVFGLAVLAHIFLIRPWYLNWGAMPEEVRMALPGDEFIPAGSDVTTRAVTIDAPVSAVWPLLLQIGQERAGFFSYYWLENLAGAEMPHPEGPVSTANPLAVGDAVSMMGGGSEATKLHVALIEPERALSFDGWTIYLQPVDEVTTRMIVRYPFQVSLPGMKAYYYGTFEMWHFIMETGMMMGIKGQAEAAARSMQ